MRKIFLAILVLFLLFLALTYWSVSTGPSEVVISKLINPKEKILAREKIHVVASNHYQAKTWKRIMQGVNYREAWEAPVPAEVFLLDSFAIIKEGGGNQSKSLKIKDSQGKVYSLRSINKDPDPLIPEVAKNLRLENVVVDGISAQHPYGAVLAASLANVVGVLHTHPKVVYVSRHKALGEFSEKYGDRLFMLEYETEGEINWTPLDSVLEIVETNKLQEMKAGLHDGLEIDHQQLVRSRLFDLLIGDWDRHSRQWGWVLQKKEEKIVAVPLPGDRDNAFFRIEGVIPTILTNRLVQPMVRPFEKDIDHMPGYVYPFDLYFLKEVPKEVFIEQANYIQNRLTDDKITQAIQDWPERLVELNGDEIAAKLKHRRDKLPKFAENFYEVIQKKEYLQKPLKGSEDLELSPHLLKCFDCN